MKKFEEEVKKPTATGLIPVTYRENVLKELSKAVNANYTKNAQILREHKGYIDFLESRNEECEDQCKQQYEEHQEIYSKTAKKLNEAELELNKLKSQLKRKQLEFEELSHEHEVFVKEKHEFQKSAIRNARSYEEEIHELKSQLDSQQPEIPEVPPFVAEWYKKVSPIFLEGCIFDFILSNPQGGVSASTEFEKWFMENNNSIEILIDMKRLGYTVNEKRFYLKNKSVLIFDPDSDDSDVEELYLGAGGNFVPYKHLAKIFTQSQIDSMETGSYEQIEVEDEV